MKKNEIPEEKDTLKQVMDAEYEPEEKVDAVPEPTEMEKLQARLDEALAQKDEYLKLAQYSKAEFDNFRRRNASVRTDALTEGAANTVTALLPILDDLERAVAAGGEGSFYEGVTMVLRRFTDALKGLGVGEIVCGEGDLFDPVNHNAVLDGPADENHPEGTIIQVLQKGYQYKDKVLRHTMVQVAK